VNRGILAKEWREQRWKVVVGSAVGAALGAALPILHGYIADLLSGVPLSGPLGSLIAAQLKDMRLYMWSNWYGKNLLQLDTFIAVLVGMGLVSGERARRTADLLFSRPLTRGELFASKYVAGLAAVAVVPLASTIAAVASAAIWAGWFDAVFLAGLVPAIAGTWLVYSLAVLASTFFSDPIKSGAGAAGLALLAAVPGWFAGTRRWSLFYHSAGWDVLRGAPGAWLAVGALVVVAVVLYAVAAARVRRLEF